MPVSRTRIMTCAAAMCFAAMLAGEAAAGATGTLSGTNTDSMRVLIRKIDNGDILWVGTYQLGTEAAIEPGTHQVSLMCEFVYSWGKQLMPGTLTIQVEPGKRYAVTGVAAQDAKSCIVTATPAN